ncbi:MAG: hypothetical protein IT428_28440 [Planctomycetaceae bacterium]|nr:hypothetical protein [Planctomycetaceae bacterium]
MLLGLAMIGGCASVPPIPGAPPAVARPYTLWTFFGLDPFYEKKCTDAEHLRAKLATLSPAFAPTAPLKSLTDPTLTQSPNVAVASAAAVVAKKAEIPQTKAALAAVAEIGCACDPATVTALAAGLDSCFPEVRLAAAEAVRKSVRLSEGKCDRGRCCSPILSEKLFQLGWGLDDRGCPVEPDGNVRLAARQAYRACGCTPLSAPDEPQISKERPRADVVKSARAGDAKAGN